MKNLIILGLLLAIAFNGFSQDYPDQFYNGEKYMLKSNILNKDADVFIYLPDDYYKDTLRIYPVHYVTDAPSVSNLYFDILRFMMYTNKTPRCIVVGLSGDDRNQNLAPGQGAENYVNYLQKEVIPFIDDTYRTSSFRALAGHSLGGGFVVYMLFTHPNLFNAYIAGSPGPPDMIMNTFHDPGKAPAYNEDYRFFYSSIGSEDFTDAGSYKKFEELYYSFLKDRSDAHFVIHEDEDHFTNISRNIQNGLRKLYRNWNLSLPSGTPITKPAAELVSEHIANLEHKYGQDLYLGDEEFYIPIVDQLGKNGNFQAAITVLKLCLTKHPQSDQTYALLALAHREIGQPEKVQYYIQKALEINPKNTIARGLQNSITVPE